MTKKNLKKFQPYPANFFHCHPPARVWRWTSLQTYSAGLQSSCKSCIQENSPPSPHPLDFGKNFYHAKTWLPMVDLLETGLWTYRKLVCGPIGNWSVDLLETGLQTYQKLDCGLIGSPFMDLLEARSWTYQKPIHGLTRKLVCGPMQKLVCRPIGNRFVALLDWVCAWRQKVQLVQHTCRKIRI